VYRTPVGAPAAALAGTLVLTFGCSRPPVASGGLADDTPGQTASGLAWLAATQEDDGHWDVARNEGTGGDAAATGLAVMAFYAHGQREEHCQHARAVARGVRWIVASQSDSGRIGAHDDDARAHAICGAALCVAYGATVSEQTEEAAARAVAYSCSIQNPDQGGWSRSAGGQSTLAATQWFLIQRKLATMTGLDVPESALDGVRSFIDKVTIAQGQGLGTCMNAPGGPITPEATASGLFCWQLMGRERTDPVLIAAADYLMAHPPVWEEGRIDFAHWYIGAHATYQMGGQHWKKWNAALRDILIGHMRTDGQLSGSWDPGDPDRCSGGRVYSTAMAEMSFGLYHRFFTSTLFYYKTGPAPVR